MFYLLTQPLVLGLIRVSLLRGNVTLCATVLTAAMSETAVRLKMSFKYGTLL